MNKNTMHLAVIVVVAVILVSFLGYMLFFAGSDKATLRLATTTSTEDSGLLDYILPDFEEEYDCDMDVIAVGSGAAMELGMRGDVDVLLVHSPAAEQDFMAGGYGDLRIQVMYNNFVIVGPNDDSAGIASASSAVDAFERIYDNGTAGDAVFVSRADNSGTHAKELAVWALLGYDSAEVASFSNTWYKQAGQGMGAVLDMCEELNGYTLSDEATYYARVAVDLIPHIEILFMGDPVLFNQYSVITVSSSLWPHVNHTMATNFAEWITSQETQQMIAGFVKYDQQLFFPNAPGYVPSSTSSLAISTLCATEASTDSAQVEIADRFDVRMSALGTWQG